MRGLYRLAGLLLVAAATLQAQAVEAAVPKEGHLVARAGRSMPKETTISVQSDEGDERSAALIQLISQSLAEKGFRVSDDGDLKLEFRIDNFAIVENSYSRSEPETTSELREQPRAESSPRTFLEPEQESRPKGLGDIHIEFFLFKNGQPPNWIATIASPRSGQDEDRQLKRMVALTMDAFGKTEERHFDVFE